MRAHEFELNGVRMGRWQKVFVASVDLGAPDWRTQDTPRPRRDGLHFGRDYKDPPVWVLNLATNGVGLEDGMSALREVQAAWEFSDRREPGAYTSLKYEVAGEIHQVFGRPRKFSVDLGRTFQVGKIRATAEFVLMDANAYLADPESLVLQLLPGSPAGLVFPAVAPFVFDSGNTSRQGMIVNSGSVPSPLRVTFEGPVVDPRVRSITHGWELAVNTSLAYDRSVTIDTRARTVTRDDGASLAHTLTRHSDLGAHVAPGFDEIVFEGLDSTGSSRGIVEWLTAVGPF